AGSPATPPATGRGGMLFPDQSGMRQAVRHQPSARAHASPQHPATALYLTCDKADNYGEADQRSPPRKQPLSAVPGGRTLLPQPAVAGHPHRAEIGTFPLCRRPRSPPGYHSRRTLLTVAASQIHHACPEQLGTAERLMLQQTLSLIIP